MPPSRGTPSLVGWECRGYPCGVEEVGALKLSNCLRDTFGWESSCGEMMGPPDNIEPGDVLVYHSDSCTSGDSHAVLVVEGGSDAKIACHSADQYGVSYTYMGSTEKFYQWLHNPNFKELCDM